MMMTTTSKDRFLENLLLQKYLREFVPSNKLYFTRKGLPKFIRLNEKGLFELLSRSSFYEKITKGMEDIGLQFVSVSFGESLLVDIPVNLRILREINLKGVSDQFNKSSLKYLEHLEILSVTVNCFFEVYHNLDACHPVFDRLHSLNLSQFSRSRVNFKGNEWGILLGKFKRLKQLSIEGFDEETVDIEDIIPKLVLKSLESFKFSCASNEPYYPKLSQEFFIERMPNLKNLKWFAERFLGDRFPLLPVSIKELNVNYLRFDRMNFQQSLIHLSRVDVDFVMDIDLSPFENSFIVSLRIFWSNLLHPIPKLPYLRRLDIPTINITSSTPILFIPSHFPKLVTLVIGRGSMIVEDQLSYLQNLQELRIIQSSDPLDMGRSLSCLPKLKNIRIGIIFTLSCSLGESFSSLEYLRIDNTSGIHQNFFDCLMKMITPSRKLKYLWLKVDDVYNISPLQELKDSLEYFYFQTGTKQGIIGAETLENIRFLKIIARIPFPIDQLPIQLPQVEYLEVMIADEDHDKIPQFLSRAPKLRFVSSLVLTVASMVPIDEVINRERIAEKPLLACTWRNENDFTHVKGERIIFYSGKHYEKIFDY